MISPEVGIGWDLPRNGSHAARVEWHLRQRRTELAYAELVAMSTDDRAAGAAPAAPVARSLGLSNCHISPQDRFPTPLHAWVNSSAAEKLNKKTHGEFLD